MASEKFCTGKKGSGGLSEQQKTPGRSSQVTSAPRQSPLSMAPLLSTFFTPKVLNLACKRLPAFIEASFLAPSAATGTAEILRSL